MKKVKMFGLFLILVMALSWAGITIDYEILPNDELPPGSNGMVSLTIANSGTDTVTLVLRSQGSAQIKSDSVVSVGSIESSGSTKVNIPFTIGANLTSGVYTLYVQVRDTRENVVDRWVYIPITVKRPVSISTSINPSSFEKDSDYETEFIFMNNGEKITDVMLIINSTNVKLHGQSSYYIGELSGSKKIVVNISIGDNATTGKTEFPIYLRYVNMLGEVETEQFDVPVMFSERNPNFLILLNESSLLPNTKNNVLLNIKNNGENIAKDVILKLSDNDVLVPLSESAVSVGTLLPGELRQVMISVAVKDVELGYYIVPFSISYKDENNRKMTSETTSVGMYISSPPCVDVYVTTSPIPVVSGALHTFSIQATNVGVSNVKSLTIEMQSNNVFKVLDSESRQYIGALESDDFSTVQYKVYVNNVNSDTYPVQFKVSYLDMANTPHEVIIEKNLNVYSGNEQFVQNDSDILPCAVLGIILLVVLAVVGYFYYKKKKKVA